ncbi:hypothetical protein Acsp05_73440 [Actinokineospora sp. NBRC 105648]|nr:hypothetical protein Acsp05_73440 [Actinokineospora sp. NBRC 105648]
MARYFIPERCIDDFFSVLGGTRNFPDGWTLVVLDPEWWEVVTDDRDPSLEQIVSDHSEPSPW